VNRSLLLRFLALLAPLAALAQVPDALAPFVAESARTIVLDHVRVIDGTGRAPVEDQRIVIQDGRIASIEGSKTSNAAPAGAKVLDLSGRTVIPGLVGMHEHLFYPLPGGGQETLALYGEMADSAPRLYLAGGVTSARTTGSMEPYTDLALKKLIDAGNVPGPKLHITGPYLGSFSAYGPQMHILTGPDDAARTVDYWAAEGVTSFKAYMDIKPDELKTAIEHAHAKGLKVTGHLCSIGFREAAALGIDNLEHGLVVDTEFYSGKKPGVCPNEALVGKEMTSLDVESAPVQEMIRDLVAHHVAVTSTLAIFESIVPNRPPLRYENGASQALTDKAWASYLAARSGIAASGSNFDILFKKEMQFERDFVKAGGLLMAGCDPTAYGGVLPGFGDQREVELLVEAGFTPVEAIHIATQNGAVFLGEDANVGSLGSGKAADIVVLHGDPSKKIDDVSNVDMVFKDGIGYDPAKLRDSVRGLMGLR